jgi:hypothetical protein
MICLLIPSNIIIYVAQNLPPLSSGAASPLELLQDIRYVSIAVISMILGMLLLLMLQRQIILMIWCVYFFPTFYVNLFWGLILGRQAVLFTSPSLANTTHTVFLRNLRNSIVGAVGEVAFDSFIVTVEDSGGESI